MTTKTDLDALLARAVALEGVLEAKGDDPAYLELKEQVAELAETVDSVLGSLDDLEGGLEDEPAPGEDPPPADPPAADPPAADPPVELTDEELAEKSWLPCPVHVDAERDEFKDGTATCVECGTTLVETKGVDFVDLDAEVKDDELELEAKADADPEPVAAGLSDFELMLARRQRL